MSVVERRDDVRRQLAVLLGVCREGVHPRIIYLKSSGGGYPQAARPVGAQCVDVVVYYGASAVSCRRKYFCFAVFDSCKSILPRTNPKAAVGGCCQCAHLLACQRPFIVFQSLVACAIPYLSALVFHHCRNVAVEGRAEFVNVLAVVGHACLLRSHPKQVGVVNIHTLYCHGVVFSAIDV